METGAPLITLDDSVDQAELHEAEAKRLLAEQSNQRVTELFSRKIASASSKDETESNLAVANAAMSLLRPISGGRRSWRPSPASSACAKLASANT